MVEYVGTISASQTLKVMAGLYFFISVSLFVCF